MNHLLYRSLFPVLHTHTHLGSCSQGALATPVSKAIQAYHDSLILNGNNWSESVSKLEETRMKFAKFICSEDDEIAVLPSVSEAISALANSLSYQQGKNKIVFTDIDFPTVGHIWSAQKTYSNEISMIRSYNGEISLEQYEKEITPNTLITCISHVNFQNGYKQDIKEIANIVHKKGSLLFVDAYQSAGQIPINVKELGIDILATGTRKYMLGIPGVAFLYVKKELAEQLKPRVTGWFGQKEESAFDIYNPVYAAGTRRFETGTPSFISVYAACTAMELLNEVGVRNIEIYLRELTEFAMQYGQEKGLEITGPLSITNRSSLTSFVVQDASRVEEKLRDKNIIVSARKDTIRIAPHFYNNKNEIKYAIDELVRITSAM